MAENLTSADVSLKDYSSLDDSLDTLYWVTEKEGNIQREGNIQSEGNIQKEGNIQSEGNMQSEENMQDEPIINESQESWENTSTEYQESYENSNEESSPGCNKKCGKNIAPDERKKLYP